MKHEIEFIIKSNESLAENKTKNKIEQLLLKYKHAVFMNTENRKFKKFKQTCCPSKLIYYYMWKNIRKQHKNNELK